MPSNHLAGNACPKCNPKSTLTTAEFITRAVHVQCAYDLENIVLSKFAQYCYIPRIHFGGSTECFSICIPIVKYLNNILRIINE